MLVVLFSHLAFHSLASSLYALQEIEKSEYKNPDHINEVPV